MRPGRRRCAGICFECFAGGVAVSTAPLSSSAAGPVALLPEPFICPLADPEADIVSPFGPRDVLVSSAAVAEAAPAKTEMHEGIDYGVGPGTEVRAARSGKVIFAGFSKMYASRTKKNEQSRLVIIRHADGQSSRYVHLGGFRVRPGRISGPGRFSGRRGVR